MTTKALKKPRHPQNKSIAEALLEDADRLKQQNKVGIQKTATLVSAGVSDGETAGGVDHPDSEQLARINEFTRSTKTAEELVVFSTLSCNNLPDRDDDIFTTECVKDFKELPQPFSPVGKSYMVGHDYSKLAVGRIFGVDTKTAEGALFLTNEVYIPNTEQHKGLIEGIDFGIQWAVSVGVMLGKDECSLSWCKAPFSSWGYWCANGHDKGMYYTEDAEEDSWGYPLPCDSRTSKSEKCLRAFKDPKDFYELSQVFLGAQYGAQLDKSVKEALSVAKTAKVPIIGLSRAEAKTLQMVHEDDKVSAARSQFSVKYEDDGSIKWTDDNDLVWTYDPTEGEVMSLGKQANDNEEDDEEDGTNGRESTEPDDANAPGSADTLGDEGQRRRASAEDDEGDEDDDDADPEGQGGNGNLSEEDDDEDEDEEDKLASVDDIVRMGLRSKLPATVLEAVSESSGDPVRALMTAASAHIESLQSKVSTLEPKAAIGTSYLSKLRAEAIDMYVKAKQTGKDTKVSTTTFEKMLDRFGDDIELFEGVIAEHKEQAQAKFPASVRRSTVDTDPNDREAKEVGNIEPIAGQEQAEKIRHLHG